jgi:small subunit ribosomal protein S5
MIEVPLLSGTIPHDVIGRFSASKVVLRPAPHGTGVIAGGAVRTVLELSGLKNIVAKKIGSANAINVARATLNALSLLKRLETVALLRGKEPRVINVETR